MTPTRQPAVRCGIVPPYLLRQLGYADTLLLDDRIRGRRRHRRRDGGQAEADPGATPRRGAWTVHDAAGTTDLPGRPVRSAGEPRRRGRSSRRDHRGAGAVPRGLRPRLLRRQGGAGLADGALRPRLRQRVLGRHPAGLRRRRRRDLRALHQGRRRAGHELAHAVTERTAGLLYQGQPGALNESVSDVFAACSEQRLLGQEAAAADWLIGAELFLPGVRARALRDMAAPGTAYDDPRLGKDPQPAHLDDYVDTTDDNGGVHLNSGIPNKAFHLAAVAVGGSPWAGAGRTWYDALTGGDVRPDTDFAGFAAATVAAAGPRAAEVEEAWRQVGVRPVAGSSAPATRGATPGGPLRTVRVRRSGGFVGRTVEAEVDLEAGDERAAALTGLVGRIDPHAARTPSHPMPDHFTYDFDLDGQQVRVPEQDLTDDLRAVADLVLRPAGPDGPVGPVGPVGS